MIILYLRTSNLVLVLKVQKMTHFSKILEIDNEPSKPPTPRSVVDWNTDPGHNDNVPSLPSLPNSPASPKRKRPRQQLAHAERLQPYDGPARSDECRQKSISYFSTCEDLQ